MTYLQICSFYGTVFSTVYDVKRLKTNGLHGYACMPPTYVALTDADPSAMSSSHDSVDNTTKSANLPGESDPSSSSRKHARAAEIVYLPWEDSH